MNFNKYSTCINICSKILLSKHITRNESSRSFRQIIQYFLTKENIFAYVRYPSIFSYPSSLCGNWYTFHKIKKHTTFTKYPFRKSLSISLFRPKYLPLEQQKWDAYPHPIFAIFPYLRAFCPYYCQKICLCKQLYLVAFKPFFIAFIQHLVWAERLFQRAVIASSYTTSHK